MAHRRLEAAGCCSGAGLRRRALGVGAGAALRARVMVHFPPAPSRGWGDGAAAREDLGRCLPRLGKIFPLSLLLAFPAVLVSSPRHLSSPVPAPDPTAVTVFYFPNVAAARD